MSEELTNRILAAVGRRNYHPLKPKALARKLGIDQAEYRDFRRVLRDLIHAGQLDVGRNQLVRAAPMQGAVTGTFRRTGTGVGYVRPQPVDGQVGPEVRVGDGEALDAATGDVVLVRLTRRPGRAAASPAGKVVRILERATRHFVGTYFEREGESFVRVDGTVFNHSIAVGDPGAKGARPDDKVVVEMLRFPTQDNRGEGVIVEVLGPHGRPGVDTLSIIRAYGLPDEFPADVLEEARAQAATFRESDLQGREDFTGQLVVTIDPVDARDFDDAVAVTRDEATGHWSLAVHIADVGHFAPPGSALDREARLRATSVYLPQRVLPMFPELISNGLASLQQDKVRYVKSALIEFSAEGAPISVRFANGAIRNRRRFSYEEVMALLDEASGKREASAGKRTRPLRTPRVEAEVLAMLLRMRDLALVLRGRRRKRGALELQMPEVELEYDAEGRVTGGHFRTHDLSHEIVEEFMLAANEAVAEQLSSLGVPFLRRIHPDPEPTKLRAFAEFARSLGYKISSSTDRFALQRILERSVGRPDRHAVHYALLRSLKQAVYAPLDEGHYALASRNYCHFTSPIRRYPDLTIHRQLDRWIRTGKARADETELIALGEHCSKMERRAEAAERELVKLKMLTYLNERLGTDLDVVITGVADYGFFGQAETLPVEGLVHVSTLANDYYYLEAETHTLIGRRSGKRYRLGDKVRVRIVRVDMQRRQLDFRVVR